MYIYIHMYCYVPFAGSPGIYHPPPARVTEPRPGLIFIPAHSVYRAPHPKSTISYFVVPV